MKLLLAFVAGCLFAWASAVTLVSRHDVSAQLVEEGLRDLKRACNAIPGVKRTPYWRA